ncbi:MAG TPA: PilN domain-containing protein [Bacillota bacterium]|nr:PilN domain-containing protein [Bacillota bacterium]
MLANINLLPQKERKSVSFIVLLVLPVLILGIGSSWMLKHYYDTKTTIGASKQELATIEKQIQAEQNKAKGSANSGPAAELEKLDQWLQANRYSTVKIIETFTSYLPERGYFESYQATQGGELNIQVQFDSLDQISAYLNQLKNSSYVQSASLMSVATQKIEKVPKDNANAEKVIDQLAEKDEGILPRYHAQLKIKINVQEVRKDQKK